MEIKLKHVLSFRNLTIGTYTCATYTVVLELIPSQSDKVAYLHG